LLLRDRHDIRTDEQDDFSVRNTKDAIVTLTAVTNALKFFLAAIAAISLIVGGVGVMNIMLASVNERIREIGLRKAVGARQKNILVQFILETIAITLSGGVIGIIFGAGFSALVALVARYLGYQWDLVVTPGSIIIGLGVAILVGLIFGLYPARSAAKLDPIFALRYE
jgi:putative ABC transport system permease protein